MGFNTALIVCNDQLHSLASDPRAGAIIKHVIDHACHGEYKNGVRKSGPAYGIYGVGALPSQHADDGQLILVGRNSIQLVGTCWTGDPLEAIRQVADQLGYKLTKKPERKTA